jgi:hypothetical protein
MRINRKTFIICIISLFVFSSCDKEEAGSVEFNIRLTDSPGNYDEVKIDFQRAQIFFEGGQDWISINSFAGFYDLLKLNNGKDTLIASRTIPTGTITQVWLILGTNNTIKVNGQIRPLVIPGAAQASIYINTNITLENNSNYTLLLDFDAARSVVVNASGEYRLYPVVRNISSANNGIRGVVTPAAATPAIYAVRGTDSVSTYPDTTGAFLIRGLIPGDYNVYFKPASGYNDTTITGISVKNGSVTVLDTIPIP